MSTPMAETPSAPSLRELSEAAWTGAVTVHEGQPCDHSDDGGGGFTLCFGGLRRTGSGPVIHRLGYAEDIREDQYPVAFAEAKANICLLARLWNDYRAGRLIDPTILAEAVTAARAEGVREGLERAADACENLPATRGDFAVLPGKSRVYWFDNPVTPWECARRIRALIPTPPTTPGGRTDG